MFEDIKTYIKSCNECQRFKTPNKDLRTTMTPIIASKPWETIGLDIVGPHTLNNGEKKHYIIAIDYFSKWVEGPVKNITTEEVIRTINQDLFWRKKYQNISLHRQAHNSPLKNFKNSPKTEASHYKQRHHTINKAMDRRRRRLRPSNNN